MTVRKRTGYHGPLSSALFSFVNTVYARPRTRLLGIAAIAQVSPSMIGTFFLFFSFLFSSLLSSPFWCPISSPSFSVLTIVERFLHEVYLLRFFECTLLKRNYEVSDKCVIRAMFCIFVPSPFFLYLFICSHDISQRDWKETSLHLNHYWKYLPFCQKIRDNFNFNYYFYFSVFLFQREGFVSCLERLIISSGCSIELFSRYPTGNSVVSKVKDTFFHSRLDDFSPRSEWLVCHPRIHSPCCSRFSSKDACPIVRWHSWW